MTETLEATEYKKQFATDKHPFDEIEWELRTAEITDSLGTVIFKQENVEIPRFWSMLATKVVVSKYFYGEVGTDNRETSVKQLISRVADTITQFASHDGHFNDEDGELDVASAENYRLDLTWLLVNQYGAFNSPVWFNVGLHGRYGAGENSAQGNWYFNRDTGEAERAKTQYEYPQGSACFIQPVKDDMESIMDLAYKEAMLFKFGSGTGTDLSTIRSSREKLSGGGTPSGPLSFLKIYDQVANVVKSGGKTRRAAKMNTLNTWHGDIEEFIKCKEIEEKKAHALIDQGYDGNFNGPAYGSIAYQNENLSVRADDRFMKIASGELDEDYWTHAVTNGQKLEKKDPSKLLDKIASGTWFCGDPGMQYDTTIQSWHTCAGTAHIHSTNPCSEYVFLDNTACNLASLNLMKFRTEFGTFDFKKFKMAVRVFIRAQEAIVDNASYPSKEIAENSHIFRTLGLGYANLGALIMSYGLPYDSFEARCLTGSITSLMTGESYAESARMAEKLGAFPGYHDARCNGVPNPIDETNVNSMSRVIERHSTEASKLVLKTDECGRGFIREIAREGLRSWADAMLYGSTAGYRNAQVTVVAPTGTIAFLMDCDTTGIEPDIALVKYKVLAGGGMLKIVNNGVKFALKQLGYKDSAITRIVAHIDKYDTIEDIDNEAISGLKPEHLPVFDCAFQASKGKRSIHYKAHLEAMAAAQPFISGAISKTVNMPKNSTVEDIRQAYIDAWKMGLKCVAIYRDGSKRSQPLNTSNEESSGKTDLSFEIEELKAKLAAKESAPRKRLPDTRSAVNHKFDVAGHEGYLTVGLFEDGTPGELFITMAKEGSTVGGLMDTIGTLTSMALQYGVPLDALVRKFSYQRFEPSGFTKNPNIRQAASIIDYVFRWISQTFSEDKLPEPVVEGAPAPEDRGGTTSYRDGQTCGSCGSSNVQVTGSCATCLNCGTSLGCS